ncbi:MAG: peptidoglycan-binding domain-containing protein [Actinomycetota bacterium]|nr:peptidoglycan-binding domain-containing protein [Actinomycetota bacterium]
MHSPQSGDRGASVRDLHRRLDEAGHPVEPRETAATVFGADTIRALLAFQAERGLDQHGLVDEGTHAALVEAGLRLGDRNLYLHSPMFRGDDVADLQLRLGSLGFDAGRIDGIFGPDTNAAVLDFQRNVGLATDGIAGPDTVRGLRHLLGRAVGRRPVAQVRELDRLRRRSTELHDQRIAIGHFGGAATLTTAVGRMLRAAGARVLELDHPDENTQAATANEFEAGLYLGFKIENHSYCCITYFATEGFHSEGGLRLAHRCANTLDEILGPDRPDDTRTDAGTTKTPTQAALTEGRRTTVLRRTRMPAVLCTLAPPAAIVMATAEIADALVGAIADWTADPAADPPGKAP